VLKEFPDESVDLVITSPPYNLGNDHHTGNKRHQAYNDDMREREYQEWQIKVLSELHRVLRPEGSLMYNHKNRIKKGRQITPYEWLLKTPFVIKQEIVWFNGSQNFDKIRFYPMTERVYWLAKSPKTKLFNTINHHDVFNRGEWKPVGTKGGHTEYLSQCQCGGRPIAYISDWGNVEIECPECETRLICGEGDVQDYLEDWGNMGITQVNQKGKQDIGQHCKQD